MLDRYAKELSQIYHFLASRAPLPAEASKPEVLRNLLASGILNDAFPGLGRPSESSEELPVEGVGCEEERLTVQLSWAKDVAGRWLAVLQTRPFLQPTQVTTCR